MLCSWGLPKTRSFGSIALTLTGVFITVVCCYLVLNSTPLISMKQGNRVLELDAVTQESRPGGRGFLVKAAGTGQEDAQCCEVNGVMPAPTTDDLGIYVIASVLGRALDDGFVENHYFRILLATWILGFTAISWFIALRQGKHFAMVFPVVAVLSYLYSLTIRGGLLFSNYGNRWGGAGDLFYGLQSVLSFLLLGLVLLSGHATRIARSRLVRLTAYSVGLLLIAATEVIRSGSIFWMSPILLWSSGAARKTWLLPRFFFLALSAWFGSKVLLLFLGTLRWFQTGIRIDFSTLSHPSWHTLYLGLAYTLDGIPNAFGVRWDDNWLYSEVARVIPSARPNSADYILVVRSWFFEAVFGNPLLVLQVMVWKLIGAVQVFWQELAIGVVLVAATIMRVRKPSRKDLLLIASLGGSLAPLLIAIPIPQYLGFALPLSHALIVMAIISLVPSNQTKQI